MKNVRNYKLQSRMLAFILAFAMVIGVCPAAFALDARPSYVNSDSVAVVTKDGEVYKMEHGSITTGNENPVVVNTGDQLIVRAGLGFNAGLGGENADVRIYLGRAEDPWGLTYFSGGGKTVGATRTADGITYTIRKDDNEELYIAVTGYNTAGGTNNFPINAYFDKSAPNSYVWNVRLCVDGTTIDEAKIQPYSTATMQTTKSVRPQNVSLSTLNGAETINEDITYIVTAFSGNAYKATAESLSNGEAAITEYTVTDTFVLPTGMYINESDFGAAVTNSFGGTITPTASDGKVTGFTITHKVTNDNTSKQIKDFRGEVKINSGYINVQEGVCKDNAEKITNSAQTAYTTTNKTAETEQVTATTAVNRPKDAEHAEPGKRIADSIDKLGTWGSGYGYLLNGDYVLYQLSFKNSGEVALENGTFTDTLGEGLIPADPSEIDAIKTYFNTQEWRDKNWSELGVAAWGDHGATVTVDGKTFTFSGISLGAGEYFNGYVLAKIDKEVTTETKLTNTANIGGTDLKVDVTVKPPTPSLSISKIAEATDGYNGASQGSISSYSKNDNIRYTVTVKNDGSADATLVSIQDLFPKWQFKYVKYDDITVSVNGGATVPAVKEVNPITAEGNTNEVDSIIWNEVVIPVGGEVKIQIPATVADSDELGDIINNASATYTYTDPSTNQSKTETVSATNTLTKFEATDPSKGVTIVKNLITSDTYVKEGDEVTYEIKFKPKADFTKENHLIIEDILPEWLTFDKDSVSGATSHYQWGGNRAWNAAFEENIRVEGNKVIFEFGPKKENKWIGWDSEKGENIWEWVEKDSTGFIVPDEIITIQYKCKVNKNVQHFANGTKFENVAEVSGGASAGSSAITIGDKPEGPQISSTGLELIKEGWKVSLNEGDTRWSNFKDNWDTLATEICTEGNKITDSNNVVSPGDKIIYRIKITNMNPEGSDPITGFTLHEKTNGKYTAFHNSNGGVNVGSYDSSVVLKVKDSNGQTIENKVGWDPLVYNSFTSDGTGTMFSNNAYFEQNKVADITFSGTDATKKFYNPDFKIAPGDYIILEGVLSVYDSFTIGGNKASVDDGAESGFDIKTVSKLTIEKAATNSKEVIVSEAGGLDTLTIPYTVTIKNDSNVPYTSEGAFFADELPEGLMLADHSIIVNNNGTALTASDSDTDTNGDYYALMGTYKTEDDRGNWSDTNAVDWKRLSLSDGNGDVLAVRINKSLTIAANSSLTITYNLKPTTEKLAALKDEIATNAANAANYGGCDFNPVEFDNIAYFYAEEPFTDKDGKTVTTILDTEDVVVRANSLHPGIEKTAYAYTAENATRIVYKAAEGSWKASEKDIGLTGDVSQLVDADSTGLAPGAVLIWKLVVRNDAAADGTGKTMSNYSLTDILPNRYTYGGTSYKNDNGITISTNEFVKYNKDGSTTTPNWFDPKNNSDGTVTWEFKDSQYNLEPGERIEFRVITTYNEANALSGVYTNKGELRVDGKIYDDAVNVGTVVGDTVIGSDSFAINTVATTSSKKVYAVNGTPLNEADKNSDGTYTVDAGSEITYELTVKNESGTPIENLTFIDRVPYQGDKGVLSTSLRGSDFAVSVIGVDRVTKNGSELTGSTVSYSSEKLKDFTESDPDWEGGGSGWTTGSPVSSTRLVRIQVPGTFEKDDEIKVYLKVKLPDVLDDELKDGTAWNTFAYCYDAPTMSATNMAAEPLPVGVKIEASSVASGLIRVKKVYNGTDEKIFYFAIYDNTIEKGGKMIGAPKSITIRGGSADKPVNGEFVFDGLEYPKEAGKEKSYYIYETNSSGTPIKQSAALGYTMNKGFYRTDGAASNNVPVVDGAECYWKKGLNMSKTSNSAIFSNLVEKETVSATPSVEMLGTYYSDIASSKDTAGNDKLYTGKTTFEAEGGLDAIVSKFEDKYNAERGDRFTQTYDGNRQVTSRTDGRGINWNFAEGWGQYQGHTVSTGFLAKITGGDETITGAAWKIKSQPQKKFNTENLDHNVYVKLYEGEVANFSDKIATKGYVLSEAPIFTDDMGKEKTGRKASKIYEIVHKDYVPEGANVLTSDKTAVGDDVGTSDENEGLVVGDEDENGNAAVNDVDDRIFFDEDDIDNGIVSDIEEESNAALNAADTDALSWTIKESSITEMTLSSSAEVYVGIILDGIYDKEAHAQLMLDGSIPTTNPTADRATSDVGNANQINVANPNTTLGGTVTEPTPTLEPTTEYTWTEYSMTDLYNDLKETNGKIAVTTKWKELTIYATTDKPVSVEAYNKTLTDGTETTHRLKFGGTGKIDGENSCRVIAVDLQVGQKIKVDVASASGSGIGRYIMLTNADKTIELMNEEAPTSGTKECVSRAVETGGTYYIYSGNSGINVHRISIGTPKN